MQATDKTHARSLLLPAGSHWQPALRPQAAVLVLLCPAPFACTVLTLRAAGLSLHAGQISFPGGRRDASDSSPEYTALREAYEETDLPAAAVEVLGRLNDTQTGSGIVITPIVGWSERLPVLTPNPDEVTSVLTLPLARALNLQAYQQGLYEIGGKQQSYLYLDHGPAQVWGATARILYELALRLASLRQV